MTDHGRQQLPETQTQEGPRRCPICAAFLQSSRKSWTLFTVKNCAFISASAASTCGNSEGHGLAGVAEASRGGGRAGRATRANATLATAFNTLPQSPSSERCSHHL